MAAEGHEAPPYICIDTNIPHRRRRLFGFYIVSRLALVLIMALPVVVGDR